ncbi:MAG: hypothetical protein WDO73_09230 [Ignavibacteriota bacterium]
MSARSLIKTMLGTPEGHALIAYLCMEYMCEFRSRRELEESGWSRAAALVEGC